MIDSITRMASSALDTVQQTTTNMVQGAKSMIGMPLDPVNYDKAALTTALVAGNKFVNDTLFGAGYMNTVSDAELEKATKPTTV
jgi:hypothetical protein